MRAYILSVGVLAGLLSAAGASAEPIVSSRTLDRPSVFMRVYGPVQPPYGFIRYCESNAEACAARGGAENRFQPTPERLSELDDVNRSINRAVEPATDAEIYGVSENWTLPARKGDCEDYALLKQRILIQRGWPASSLLLTVVRDEKGEGHAVLTARTAQGDFILDNKMDEVRLWHTSGYEFIMRQSYLNPRVWVSLDPAESTLQAAIAGVGGGN